jgi:Cortical protein marker for cell polarity
MRLRNCFRPSTAEVVALFTSLLAPIQAVDLTPVPSPNLDFSQLGRVALTGSFDSIASYTYQGQSETPFTNNGSQSLLTQMPNGVFAPLAASDASIVTMCPFVRKNGDFAGIVVGGNFTSLQGVQAQGVALWDPQTNAVTPLPGLNGSVNAVYCDQDMDSVYVGGMFHGGNSTNAIVWLGMTGWSNTPFAGFNGPVYTINKAPSGDILFGGSFTGLGNVTNPDTKNQQVVNLSGANVTAGPPATDSAFSDPKNIICQQSDTDGPGTTWLTADNGGGYYRADFDMGFIPSRLRLYNTHYQGRGTKNFRFTAFPINGIMNFTYFNPDTQKNESCTSDCPLSQDKTVNFQDFTFVNPIGMQGFQIDISAFYGQSAGLDGIELYQNDIYTYAVNSLNEPACNGVDNPAKATTVGPWQVQPQSSMSGSSYLMASLNGPGVNEQSAQVVYQPDIRQSGTYMVTIYTPGCSSDGSCSKRGISNVTGIFSSNGSPVTKQIYQTNQFDKYDQIFSGQVDATDGAFKPTITVSPLATQDSSIDLVALRVRFQLMSASGGSSSSSGSSGGSSSDGSSNSSNLNGLFDYNPTQTFSTDFAKDTIDVTGSALSNGAEVNSIAVVGQTTFVAGNFTTSDYSNIFQFDGNTASSLPAGGLNDAVSSMYVFGDHLFVSGNFTNTAKSPTGGLNRVAVYDTTTKVWGALGSGVDGPVNYLVPLQLNISQGVPETCITVNGQFTTVLQSAGKPEFQVANGLAIYVPSHRDWLHNLNIQVPSIHGSLTAATNVTNGAPLLAGSITSQGWALNDAVSLSTADGNVNIAPAGLTFQNSGAASQQKRDLFNNSFTGALTGLFDDTGSVNMTILAGHFTVTASDGTPINNLAILNTTSDGNQGVSGLATGLDSNSTFRAVALNNSILYAGGQVTGKVNGNSINGLVMWDLNANKYADQPPALAGPDVAVYSIAMRPASSDLYVGGVFEEAGALPCSSLCYYSNGQWQAPGSGLTGTVSNLLWQSGSNLLVAGNMTVQNDKTYVATYDADAQSSQWSVPKGADAVPGPVVAVAQASSDGSQYWLAGSGTDGSAYLIKYDGTKFNPVPNLFGAGTDVHGLSVVTLSQGHNDNSLLENTLAVLITGNINVPSFGNASAVLFNGTSLTPLILASSGSEPGTLSQMIVQNVQNFSSLNGGMPIGDVVAIALAVALGVMFLLVALGLLLERRRRKAEGYRPAPQNYFEKTANMGRIPPERLFSSLNTPPSGPQL